MKRMEIALLGLLLIAVSSCKKAGLDVGRAKFVTVTTVAGAGVKGYLDGLGDYSLFNSPKNLAVDASGNIFVADVGNNRIRKISATGMVTTFAGDGTYGFKDGPAATAQFNRPWGVAVDGSGNVYVADLDNNRIRKITPDGMVSTLAGDGTGGFADGPGASAKFNGPFDLKVDANGNVFVADGFNYRIRKITPAGVVSTFSGTGDAGFTDGNLATATHDVPTCITFDPSGNMYTAEYGCIRKITPDGTVSLFAGKPTERVTIYDYQDGPALGAMFREIYGLASDAEGNIYVGDQGNNVIRKITPKGKVSTYAGVYYLQLTANPPFKHADGLATEAYFLNPMGLCFDEKGALYVAESGAAPWIRKIENVDAPKTKEELEKDNWNKPNTWK